MKKQKKEQEGKRIVIILNRSLWCRQQGNAWVNINYNFL